MSSFQQHLPDIPVVPTTIAGTRIVGSMIVGNSHGILCPPRMTEKELLFLRNSLPDDVVIERVQERLTALGNCISCNDYYALVHPSINKKTMEIIEDVLHVEAIKMEICGNPLVGSFCVFNNAGGLVHPKCSTKDQNELANLLHIPMVAGTVNQGSKFIGAGMVVNDWTAFTGLRTTATEIQVIESIFSLKGAEPSKIVSDMRNSILDNLK